MRTIRGGTQLWTVALLSLAAWVGGCGLGEVEKPRARVTIDSSPESGAEVRIGGVSYGPTPAVVEGLRPGTVFVALAKKGYKRTVNNILIPETGEAAFTIELTPRVGYVSIESEPSRSKVFLDDTVLLGETPLAAKAVPVGKHTYTVKADLFVPETNTLTVEEDYRYTFKHVLKPMPATVTVYSTPSNARIWLNDQEQGKTTPASFVLESGAYSVTVFAKGYVSQEQAIVLRPNEERALELKMEPGEVPPGMVLISAGEFLMGLNGPSPDERPQRKVFVDAFYMDKLEVTNAEFKRVFPSFTFKEGEEQFPASGVSFEQAAEYARFVKKRLPTEAEWEKAARGVDGREYPWGNEFDSRVCNSNKSGFSKPLAVGSFRGGASPYGCLEMAGNVYEWTADWYQPYEGNKDIETAYGQEFRVLRGGSYLSGAFEVRCARRHYDRMDAVRSDYGFRCAADVAAGPERGGAKPGHPR